jgi:serine/threonine protein kinase
MGEVHEVVWERKRCALKVMDVAGYSEREIKKRLLEGQIHREIEHPNVVRVFDTGVTRDDVAWILMELLYGCTVRDMLSNHSPCRSRRPVGICCR